VAVFEYHGILSTTGKSVQGVRDAENAKVLRGVLRKDGILLTQAAEEKAAKAKAPRGVDLRALFQRPSVADIALMTRQLSTLVGAKIPLFEALSALIEQVEKQGLRYALTNVRDQVREGTSFATALERPTPSSSRSFTSTWCVPARPPGRSKACSTGSPPSWRTSRG
jgi:general secretion pathway protein F